MDPEADWPSVRNTMDSPPRHSLALRPCVGTSSLRWYRQSRSFGILKLALRAFSLASFLTNWISLRTFSFCSTLASNFSRTSWFWYR